MDTIVEVLDVKIKVKTDKDEEKIICITDFRKPQNVDLIWDNDDFTLSVKFMR